MDVAPDPYQVELERELVAQVEAASEAEIAEYMEWLTGGAA